MAKTTDRYFNNPSKESKKRMLTSTLNDIGLRHGTDKASNHHDFLDFYDERLSWLRNEKVVVFEFGVYRGGSIKMWGEYFPSGTIVGCDVDESCRQFNGGSVYIRIGDQSDPLFLAELIREFGRPHVVIDDGSHRWDHQIASLQFIFPILLSNGVYILEDLDTSFDGHLKQAPFDGYSSISAFDYLSRWARLVVGDAAVQDERPYDLFQASNYKKVRSIEMFRRTSIIRKRPGVD